MYTFLNLFGQAFYEMFETGSDRKAKQRENPYQRVLKSGKRLKMTVNFHPTIKM